MMKHLTLLLVMILSGSVAFAQYERCMTMPVLEKQKANDPALHARMQDVETAARAYLRKNPAGKDRSTSAITIPVVVHVVYKTAAENIPDSQIVSQINVLNEDYRRLNANYSQTRPVFDTVSADTEIEFCLASVDPNGNPTNGITRTQTTMNSFDPIFNFDKVKSGATGGKDPWPASDYLNIWVCNMSVFGQVFVLGYAQFPGGNAATDGVVIQYQHFGRVNYPTAAPADLGRTTTHEVGHWLGMRHIWGDDQGACDSTDYVADTPNCGDNSQTTCEPTRNSCNDSGSVHWGIHDVPDMIENYMDYSTDACMTMFTKGQKARMWSFLNTARSSLATSPGCGVAAGIRKVNDVNFAVFPNPAKDQLSISLKETSGSYELSLTDVTGRKVNQVESLTAGETLLNIEELPGGIYLLTVQGNGKRTVKKIVIQ